MHDSAMACHGRAKKIGGVIGGLKMKLAGYFFLWN
jgi:hypothetical protein